MKLFGFIEFLDLLPVGRNARCLRTPPTTEIGSAQPVVILSETKDLKARFFANEAQNDKIKNGCASRVEKRNPAYKGNISQNDEMKERKTGGVRNKSGFRPTGLNDRIAGKHGGLPLCQSYERNITDTYVNADPHPRSLRSRNQPLAGLRLPEGEGVKNRAPLTMTIVLLCLMLLAFIVNPVVAQEPTTRLFFNPTPMQIDTTISPSGVVTLEVADGVDIFAFDLFVQYDPSLLSVSQVTLGDFLGEGLFCMDQVNEPGLVHYSCTRFAVETGVSGSGVLLELTFEAFGQAGDTTLTLDGSALYESQDAFLIDATLEDGAVSVRPYRTYLPLIFSASGQGLEATP